MLRLRKDYNPPNSSKMYKVGDLVYNHGRVVRIWNLISGKALWNVLQNCMVPIKKPKECEG